MTNHVDHYLDQARRIAESLDAVLDAELQHDRHGFHRAMVAVRRAVIEFGAELPADGPAHQPAVDAFLEQVLPKLRRAYELAGYPCGAEDDGVWHWLREQAAIAAEAERIARERHWQRGLDNLHAHAHEQSAW